jgi:hypothetical protein
LDGRGWGGVGGEPTARPLPTQVNTQREETQTYILEPTIPLFERAKTLRNLDHTATVVGFVII